MTEILSSELPGTIGARTTSTVIPASTDTFDSFPYVEWPSIFVGTVVALAVAFVLLTFGSAVGFSAVSPWTTTRASFAAVSIGAGFWMILVHIWSFSLGGYLAGRMRHRHIGASQMEVDFRDGAHGLAVWGLAVSFGGVIAALAATSAMRSGGESYATGSRINDPVAVATDTLLRTTRPTPAAPTDDIRGEVGRLLARSLGPIPMAREDHTYLANVVAARTGAAADDADKRIDEVVTQMKNATDRARKAGIIVGFITAATLLIGAAAAWWGGSVGGKHRDENTLWAGFVRQQHPRSIWSKP